MLDIFAEKLKSFGKLPQKEQDILIQKHKQILLNKVIPAYQNLFLVCSPSVAPAAQVRDLHT